MEEDGKDEEGYYAARAGDYFNKGRYAIVSAVGRGVFSSVLRAKDTHRFDADVAIKVIRNNETMTKLAQKELQLLEELRCAPACLCSTLYSLPLSPPFLSMLSVHRLRSFVVSGVCWLLTPRILQAKRPGG